MAQDNIMEYKGIDLSPAENGFILRYCECKPSTNRGTYDDGIDRSHKELIFKDNESDKAFDKFKELHMFNKKKGSNESSNPHTLKGY